MSENRDNDIIYINLPIKIGKINCTGVLSLKKRSPIAWTMCHVKKRIPALVLLTASNIGVALFGVAFALGTRGVIDAAVDRDKAMFLRAVVIQGLIITGMLLCATLGRYINTRVTDELDRDWKEGLLHKLLHGSYEAVSAYHSGELLNRMNNDVRILDSGLVSTFPSILSMFTKLIAAAAVLVAMEPWFTLLLICGGLAVILVTALMRSKLKGLH